MPTISSPLIRITQGQARRPELRLAAPVDFTLHRGEHLALIGPNGGGKSLFVAMLTGAHPLLGDAIRYDFGPGASQRVSRQVRHITFRGVYGASQPAYYQQRWNRFDEQTFPTVGELLERARAQETAETAGPADEERNGLAAELDGLLAETGIMEHLLKPVNLLSSGELRRLQIAQMLCSQPQLLIIDNPYIGLDKGARAMMSRLLERLSHVVTLVVAVSRAEDVPPCITEVIPIENKTVGAKCSLAEWTARQAERAAEGGVRGPAPAADTIAPATDSAASHPQPTAAPAVENGEAGDDSVIDFRHITIRYGERTILDDLTWHVHRGEHWALTGPNGAGKSTLLSLVCADNPQGYACDISLFGRRRGTGESIWDIKRRIGYVAPELFTTYRKDLPAVDIVASGLHDTIGMYRRVSDEERATCRALLERFEAADLAERSYLTLSSGEQRLILLVRAFAKRPDLLILDEPFHGLDTHRRSLARRLIDDYMADTTRTLIMVTHYEEELPACIDHRLTLVKHG